MKARVCGRCGQVVSGSCSCAAPPQSTARNGYGRKWQRFVKALYQQRVREGKALCAMCGLAFTSTPHGDHIRPVTSATDARFYDANNVQFLHASCHGKKTARDVMDGSTRGGRGRRNLGGA